MMRRLGESEENILIVQSNIANSYEMLGRLEQCLRMRQDVYLGRLRLSGKEHRETLISAVNYAVSLRDLKRFEETKALLRKTVPVARRVLGENKEVTLRIRLIYVEALFLDDGATLDDLRESVTTLEEIERTARRVFGGAHPLTTAIEDALQDARAALRARETPAVASDK